MNLQSIEVAKKFKGFHLENAEGIASAFDWIIRVVRLDGKDLACTAEYIPRRINVVVENGIIIEVLNLG